MTMLSKIRERERKEVTAKRFQLVKDRRSVMLCSALPPLSFDPSSHAAEEKLKKQPILPGKEVEGKLLIGYREHSCVLLFSKENSICQKCRAV